ncbi:hypothetical protein AJ80_01697 [Polytolypa hystricis UAMH7299]|uniref:alpha-1,2-Mannosidase n=1 Tax=Polytolypa hystricis (strain UAMH7299) TaxID=1447883 RepID=A0A2B7Z0A7_POLH7|nr:hypothetical protein AJ80_01697 [Polytolypa hystricis UAMH7299]
MIRIRRYRIFLAFAAISVLAFVHFARMRDWTPHPVSNEQPPVVQKPVVEAPAPAPVPPPAPAPESPPAPEAAAPPPAEEPAEKPAEPDEGSASHGFNPEDKLAEDALEPKKPADDVSEPKEDTKEPSKPNSPTVAILDDEFGPEGQGRLDAPDLDRSEVRWKKQPEHFPIDPESLITLPTGTPKTIPQIQFDFPEESAEAKKAREEQLALIKDSFNHSWSGYKEYAWGHDEVRPVYGGNRDPFAGWGATLVDALDTLWIMGMEEEFEEAVEAVKKIDFTTSRRKDIPVFETVIRYLGGLIGAYDISGGKYQALIDKAVELAEILMGAFDTPNRMPVTYYHWAPAYASQPHRAGVRAVLAEIASLTVEFTRLAQITGEEKYYDAVARITNALEEFQDETDIPGLWPAYIDASGCKKALQILQKGQPVITPSKQAPTIPEQPISNDKKDKRDTPEDDPLLEDAEPANYDATPEEPTKKPSSDSQVEPAEVPEEKEKPKPTTKESNCAEQGLASPPHTRVDKFTLGGLADSAYEYLPKEFMLLGGLSDQYRTLYEKSMKATRDKLLFRPMIPDNDRDILSLAAVNSKKTNGDKPKLDYMYEGTHLGCFAGGMFGIGAKIFDLEEDLEIASKLTDGCVWAYESTKTGIMPESFELLPCDSVDDCKWNQTRYYEALDPYQAERKSRLDAWYDRLNALDSAKTGGEEPKAPVEPKEVPEEEDTDTHAKRDGPVPPAAADRPIPESVHHQIGGKPVVVPHEEYAETRIKEERLPPGFTGISSRKYILRPEAIESVFIMYRITGDEIWREKGWQMFKAIEAATRTELASSAIKDVTSELPFFLNEMESFWLAETLKYFYLLFSDASVVSLDEYVL